MSEICMFMPLKESVMLCKAEQEGIKLLVTSECCCRRIFRPLLFCYARINKVVYKTM